MACFSSGLDCLSILFTQRSVLNAQAGKEMIEAEELATFKGDHDCVGCDDIYNMHMPLIVS